MKIKGKPFIIYLITGLLFGTGIGFCDSGTKPTDQSSSPIQWQPYQKGIELGKSQSKKIFLNFYADWCRYCKQMDQQTFTDDSIINYLNEYFISIRVDSDKQQKLAMAYNVRGLPVSWFIAENGKEIGALPGYLPPDRLLAFLKFIHTDSYKKMNFSTFLKQM